MGKQMLEITNIFGEVIKVSLRAGCYEYNKNFALFLIEEDGTPYANLTTNLDYNASKYCAFLDTNNLRNAEEFVINNQLGEFTGLRMRSGYCVYPLYRFYPEKIALLCPDSILAYTEYIHSKEI